MHVLYSIVLWSALLVVRSVANRCPSPDSLHPCNCEIEGGIPKTRCTSIYQMEVLKHVFSATGDHPLVSMDVRSSVLSYFPASALKEKSMKELFLQEVHMVGLFDRVPEPNHKLNTIITFRARILRGMEWTLLKNLNNLTMLHLESVTARSLGKEFMENIPSSITELSVANASLSRLDDHVFSGMHKLVSLNLMEGMITTLKRTMFPSKNVIKHLSFMYNRISDLPDDIFSDMPKLEVVILEGNLLTTISEPAFKSISETDVQIKLLGNNIECNCQIRWMLKKQWKLRAKCQGPEEFKGRNLGGPSNGISDSDLSYCDDQ